MKQKFQMPDGEIAEKDMPVWKTPWNHDTNFESDRTATYCAEPSLAKQEFLEDSNINTIMERALRTGQLPELALPEAFLDVTGRTTYYDMETKIADANELFYKLPPKLRAEFLNDPTRWADAIVKAVDAGDTQTLRSIGIAVDDTTGKPQTADQPPAGTPAAGGSVTPPAAPNAAPPPGAPNVTPA